MKTTFTGCPFCDVGVPLRPVDPVEYPALGESNNDPAVMSVILQHAILHELRRLDTSMARGGMA